MNTITTANTVDTDAAPLRHWPAVLAFALGCMKLGIGVVLLIRAQRGDLETVPLLVQLAAYLVVIIAVVIQRRIGLAFATAFVGYSVAVGLNSWETSAGRIILIASSVALALALVVNLAFPGRITFDRDAIVAIAFATAVGIGIGLVVDDGDFVERDDDASDAPDGAANYIPRQAQDELAKHIGIEPSSDRFGCVLTGIFDEFGPSVMSWSMREPSDEEQRRISAIAADCDD